MLIKINNNLLELVLDHAENSNITIEEACEKLIREQIELLNYIKTIDTDIKNMMGVNKMRTV